MGTELIGTDYIRAIGGIATIMRECEPGSFVGVVEKHAKKTVPEDAGPVMSDNESFDDTKQSPKRLALKFMQSELEKLFDAPKTAVREDGERCPYRCVRYYSVRGFGQIVAKPIRYCTAFRRHEFRRDRNSYARRRPDKRNAHRC
jgi:hypothetical protein